MGAAFSIVDLECVGDRNCLFVRLKCRWELLKSNAIFMSLSFCFAMAIWNVNIMLENFYCHK